MSAPRRPGTARANDLSGNVSLAGGNDRVQGMFFGQRQPGRCIQDPRDRRHGGRAPHRGQPAEPPRRAQILAKLTFTAAPGNRLRAAAEVYETRVDTEGFSQRGTLSTTSSDFFAGIRGVPVLPPGPTIRIDTADFDTVDTQQRWRLSLDQTLAGRAGLDLVSWMVHGSRSDTSQLLEDERTVATLFGGRPLAPPTPEQRLGTFDFDQRTVGGTAQGRKRLGGAVRGVVLTFGGSYQRDRFDTLRDIETRALLPGPPLPGTGTGPVYPTKFFPASDVTEAGAYLQAEIETGRFTITPGRTLRPLRNRRRPARRHLPDHPQPDAGRLLGRRGLAEAGRGGASERRLHPPRPVRQRVPRAAVQRRQQRLHEPGRRRPDAAQPRPASGDE